MVEPGFAVFAFLGGAERVDLLRWIHAGVDRVPFVRVRETDLWLLRLAVADEGRFEYKLAIGHGGQEDWILDPLNPDRASDPFGENSVSLTYGYERPSWTLPTGAPQGRMIPLVVESTAFGEMRHETLYLPPGHDLAKSYPFLVIHDGQDFNTYADLSVSLDNLIAAGDIPPVIAALIQTKDRTGEYPGSRRHARYVVEELLPLVEGRFRILDEPDKRVLLGASLGAVASLAIAFRFPGTFGGLVLKSGSFILNPGKLASRPHPVFHRVARLVQAIHRARNLPPTRAFVSTGELEGLAEENRALASLLRERGVDVLFKSAWDGHHWHNWRDQLRDALMFVLGTGAR